MSSYRCYQYICKVLQWVPEHTSYGSYEAHAHTHTAVIITYVYDKSTKENILLISL